MNKPYVSIIIPSFNSSSTLKRTIEACLEQDYPKDRLEIIIVDDGSTDNTKKIVEDFPVRYTYQERKGPAQARNNGWKNSKGEALCFIDADCIPQRDWVSKLVQHYDKTDIGAVAGSYTVDGLRFLLDKFVHYEIKYRHSRMSRYINSFGTYNVLIKRSVFQELNGFDPLYCNASGEDSDLSYRIIKGGYKIYFDKEALVSHRNILGFWRYVRVQFQHGYWRIRLYRKNSSMIMKDDYAYWKDFIEVFLLILLLTNLLINFQTRFIWATFLVIALFIVQLPLSIKISLEHKNILYLIFSFVTFIRAFVRVLGGILGFISFCIIRKR